MNSQLPDTQTWEGVVYSQDVVDETWGMLYSVKNRFETLGLTKNEYSIGRLPSCDIILEKEENVSRRQNDFLLEREQFVKKLHVGLPQQTLITFSKLHCKIKKDVSVVFLEDYSSNGTYVNGKVVGRGKKIILQSNDQISLSHQDYKVYVFVNNTDEMKLDVQGYPTEVKDHFVVSRSLGKGAYGEVMLVFQKRTFERYAMKVIQKKTLNPHQTKDMMMNEAIILKSLNHPCILKVHNVVDSPERLFIFLEFMEGGDLFDRVKLRGKLTESVSKWFLYQISRAVHYLHDQGIAHRDLKPENILLSSSTDDAIIKITDFGLSRFFSSKMVMQTLCGTPLYVAPEILETRGCGAYSNAVDVWSMGVILYVCLSGCAPFNPEREDMNLSEQICSGSYNFPGRYWRNVGIVAIELVKKMMTVNPKTRITIQQISSHSWFKDRNLQKNVKDMNLFSNEQDQHEHELENEPPRRRPRLDF